MDHIIFRNEENGYTVLNLKMKGAELTCIGTLPAIGEGELIEAVGTETEHSVYGRQFRIESYETKVPEDSAALERYLGSGAIKGSERRWPPELSGTFRQTHCESFRKSRNALQR